ncbi:hypothetical protein Tsubulata_045821 [Turnera subulata]|uniref:Uncharacterized protein n=1 Tax=Turnera subulata TaxID=218843 RepID=A0A9Q0G946_9ROSI|nr:hypothetical protein Tsubulata_045821 [Turnera subulata]
MLQLMCAVAFSAVPLTLYVPPVRSLNVFLEALEDLMHHFYSLSAYSRLRLVCSSNEKEKQEMLDLEG